MRRGPPCRFLQWPSLRIHQRRKNRPCSTRSPRANVLADPRLFATLDPTLRRLELPSNRRALLSDTVGFIRNLPPALIQAFRATLEEVTEADLLVHVVDVSAEHRRVHREQVDRVLDELGASAAKPQLLVLNKCDLLDRGLVGPRNRARAVTSFGHQRRCRVRQDGVRASVDCWRRSTEFWE